MQFILGFLLSRNSDNPYLDKPGSTCHQAFKFKTFRPRPYVVVPIFPDNFWEQFHETGLRELNSLYCIVSDLRRYYPDSHFGCTTLLTLMGLEEEKVLVVKNMMNYINTTNDA